MKKLFTCLSLALCASAVTPAVAATGTDSKMDLAEAYAVIQEYRALRESCAAGDYEQRRQCVSELSKASDSYRQAKELIGSQSLSSMHKTLASH